VHTYIVKIQKSITKLYEQKSVNGLNISMNHDLLRQQSSDKVY